MICNECFTHLHIPDKNIREEGIDVPPAATAEGSSFSSVANSQHMLIKGEHMNASRQSPVQQASFSLALSPTFKVNIYNLKVGRFFNHENDIIELPLIVHTF